MTGDELPPAKDEWCDCCSAGNHNSKCTCGGTIECCHPLYHQGYEVGYAAWLAWFEQHHGEYAAAAGAAGYGALAAAQDDEDRAFHEGMRGRRRGASGNDPAMDS